MSTHPPTDLSLCSQPSSPSSTHPSIRLPTHLSPSRAPTHPFICPLDPSVHLNISPSISSSTHLSIQPATHQFVRLDCLSIHPFWHLPTHLTIYPPSHPLTFSCSSIHYRLNHPPPSTHPFVHSNHVSVHPCPHPPTHLSVYPPNHPLTCSRSSTCPSILWQQIPQVLQESVLCIGRDPRTGG